MDRPVWAKNIVEADGNDAKMRVSREGCQYYADKIMREINGTNRADAGLIITALRDITKHMEELYPEGAELADALGEVLLTEAVTREDKKWRWWRT